MRKPPRIKRYMRCPRCREDINAAWWTDNVIDCAARCGIYHLSDCEEDALERR